MLGSASFFVVRPESCFYTMSHQNVTACSRIASGGRMYGASVVRSPVPGTYSTQVSDFACAFMAYFDVGGYAAACRRAPGTPLRRASEGGTERRRKRQTGR